MSKKKVLFICKNNSGRSQMAEGLLKHIHGDNYDAHSAGSDPKGVNPLTTKVMAEIGIDISDHSSNHLEEYWGHEFDYVITLCGNHDESCPVFLSGKKTIYRGFKDPATYYENNMEKIDVFRLIRNEIKDWIENSFINDIEK
jgi:arsenate reductase